MHSTFWSENLKARDLGVNERITLKWLLKRVSGYGLGS